MKKWMLFVAACVAAVAVHARWVPAEWPVLKTYDKDHLYNISMPVGGIGTGTVGLGGRGELRDWQIMNKPAIGYSTVTEGNDAPFFAIWVKPQEGDAKTRALIGPLDAKEYQHYEGRPVNHHGLPRFAGASFGAAYPFGQVTLTDSEMPVKVRIKAFNPLVPGDADASGIPIAVLTYEVENTSGEAVDVSVCGNMRNFVGRDGSRFATSWKGDYIPQGAKGNVNEYRPGDGFSGIYMYSAEVDSTDAAWGTIALTTNASQGISYRRSSTPNSWSNAMLDFWDDFSADGVLTDKEKLYEDDPMASLAVKQSIAPGEKKCFTFFITWNFPNRLGWVSWENPNHNKTVFGNYYSTKYADAWDVAEKTLPELPRLERQTLDFVNAVVDSDLPPEVRQAALFNLAVLHSQTVFRLPSGHMMGWEGIMDFTGSCFGSCTHVWNYEQATAFLFGELARSMRDVEFNYALNDKGAMAFRAKLPLSSAAPGDKFSEWDVAADGQMGAIMKFYRDWQLSGDNDFLCRNWPQVRSALAFAWTGGLWDIDKDGVMEGVQHNTMDVCYYGPNPQMGVWYLGALKAGSEMAAAMKDREFKKTCDELFAKGSRWIDANLFNGEYYEHKITDPDTYEFLTDDYASDGMPPYQLGRGCLVDQLVGQYMAHICGLGYLVDKNHVATTLQSIMRYNYRPDFSDHFNNMRSYALGNEAGLLMASWPNGRMKVPFPYFPEVMTGFEYSAAVGMLYEGLEEDGLTCIRAIRDRFDGDKRNPFSEAECGHFYARSMASWASLVAMTGFNYSGVDKSMAFTSRPGKYFWSNGSSWGVCEVTGSQVYLTVLHGSLALDSFTVQGSKPARLKNFTVREGETRFVQSYTDPQLANLAK